MSTGLSFAICSRKPANRGQRMSFPEIDLHSALSNGYLRNNMLLYLSAPIQEDIDLFHYFRANRAEHKVNWSATGLGGQDMPLIASRSFNR